MAEKSEHIIFKEDTLMEFVTLNTGAKMPLEGFGVFQVPDPAVCEQAVYDAIKTGYHVAQQRGKACCPRSEPL